MGLVFNLNKRSRLYVYATGVTVSSGGGRGGGAGAPPPQKRKNNAALAIWRVKGSTGGQKNAVARLGKLPHPRVIALSKVKES